MSARATGASPKKDARTGKWYFVFESIHPQGDGSRRQIKRRGFPTRGAAQLALDEARRDDRERFAPADAGLTVAAVLDQFVRAKQLSGRAPNTIEQYRWAAGIVKGRWGGWGADKLTGDHLEAAYVEMLAGGRRQWRRGKGTEATASPMSRRSVEVVHKTVKAAYRLAVDKGQLVRNPAALVEVGGTTDRGSRPFWTPEQVGTFLDYVARCDDLPVGLVATMIDTGARVGEVMHLEWANVDLDAGTVRILRQLVPDPADAKTLTTRPTKRPRSKSTIGLHPATVSELRRRRAEQNEDRLKMGAGWPTTGMAADFVFTWPDGTPMHPKTVSRIVARLAVAAGLPRITAHGLRHSFATAALSARVPVEVVAARLGNTPRVVQEVYQHVIPADDAAAARLVGDLFRQTSG
jgi:integrase